MPDKRTNATRKVSTDSRPWTFTQLEAEAWGGFLRTYNSLTRKLEAELDRHSRITLPWFNALLVLRYAPEMRLRLKDLADALVFSRAGVTRIIDKLEAEGAVRRQPDPEDGRSQYVSLTPEGLRMFEEANEFHFAKVRERFWDHFSKTELQQLVDAWSKLLDPDEFHVLRSMAKDHRQPR